MTQQTPSPVLQAADAYRIQLLAKDAQALNRLIDAYKRSYSRLLSAVDALTLQIGQDAPTAGQVIRLQRYKSLMAQVAEELSGLQSLTRNEIELATELGIDLGSKQARELLSYVVTGTPSIAGQFNALPRGVIQQLLGFLAPDGPLYKRLMTLAPYNASLVSDAITSGVALGFNPRKIAALVRDAFGGGLTDALRFVRTAQLWSYREASRATYTVNDVQEWIWHAELGPRTCPSCLAMHGTRHPMSETLNDHHNGRCAMIPVVEGFPTVVEPGEGEAWLRDQPESVQRQILGKGKFEAWRDGGTPFADLTTVRNDPVYGPMRVEAPLWQFLGAEPPR